VEKNLAIIRSQLTDKEFFETSEKGFTMATDQTIALSLEN
jgi:hypothetical protein